MAGKIKGAASDASSDSVENQFQYMERDRFPDIEPTEADLHAELTLLVEEAVSTKVLDDARCDRIREILEHLDALNRKQ